jgi:hypothetical protein
VDVKRMAKTLREDHEANIRRKPMSTLSSKKMMLLTDPRKRQEANMLLEMSKQLRSTSANNTNLAINSINRDAHVNTLKIMRPIPISNSQATTMRKIDFLVHRAALNNKRETSPSRSKRNTRTKRAVESSTMLSQRQRRLR